MKSNGNGFKSHPFTKLLAILGHDVDKLDNDPKIQLIIHTWGFWYWIINFFAITYMFFFMPAIWLRYGLFITLIYSIYANFTSDYTGMSAAQAVINTQGKEVEAKAIAFPGSGIEVEVKDE